MTRKKSGSINISEWNVSKVTDMLGMFRGSTSFNQNLNKWNVSKVTDMQNMFWDATSFSGNVNEWDISGVFYMQDMFQNINLSTHNYDSLLNGWANLPSVNNNVNFNGGGSKYSNAAVVARAILIGTYGWTIIDGDIFSSSLSCGTDADSDGFIDFLCAIYPMTDMSYEGDLDTNDIINTIQPDMSCLFKSDKSGCESNLVINGCGGGTVLDTSTSLCWERDMSSSSSGSNGIYYCGISSLAGHTDWRLPSLQELLTISDISRNYPAIVGGNTIFQNIQNKSYVSSTIYRYSLGVGYYAVRLSTGGIFYITKSGGFLCVR